MSNALTSRLKKKKKGFTLIELIIVMAIIVILAAIAIPGFSKIRDDSRKKSDDASADTIKKTIMTLLTDGKLSPGADFSIDPSKTDSTRIADYTTSTEGTATQDELASYFNNVNKPQESAFSKYHVKVATDESVTVTPSN